MKISTAFTTRNKSFGTINTEPSMTDQSQAEDTDANRIVGKFLKTGSLPPGPGNIRYGDFTTLPNNLQDFFKTAKSVNENRSLLPEQLRELPLDELLALTPDDIKAMLNPPDKPADKPVDKPQEAPKP